MGGSRVRLAPLPTSFAGALVAAALPAKARQVCASARAGNFGRADDDQYTSDVWGGASNSGSEHRDSTRIVDMRTAYTSGQRQVSLRLGQEPDGRAGHHAPGHVPWPDLRLLQSDADIWSESGEDMPMRLPLPSFMPQRPSCRCGGLFLRESA